jgi:hypothetical protein
MLVENRLYFGLGRIAIQRTPCSEAPQLILSREEPEFQELDVETRSFKRKLSLLNSTEGLQRSRAGQILARDCNLDYNSSCDKAQNTFDWQLLRNYPAQGAFGPA